MVNKAILIGNLGKDPQITTTQSGTVIANLNIATSEKKKNAQTGNWDDHTEWHKVTCFNKQAEFCNYLKKGYKVYVEGRLRTNKWQDQNGVDRWTTEILVDQIKNLTPRAYQNQEGEQQNFQNSGGQQQQNFQNSGGQQQQNFQNSGGGQQNENINKQQNNVMSQEVPF